MLLNYYLTMFRSSIVPQLLKNETTSRAEASELMLLTVTEKCNEGGGPTGGVGVRGIVVSLC